VEKTGLGSQVGSRLFYQWVIEYFNMVFLYLLVNPEVASLQEIVGDMKRSFEGKLMSFTKIGS